MDDKLLELAKVQLDDEEVDEFIDIQGTGKPIGVGKT
jgi:hypothetical protein